jgi:hypothetical protein
MCYKKPNRGTILQGSDAGTNLLEGIIKIYILYVGRGVRSDNPYSALSGLAMYSSKSFWHLLAFSSPSIFGFRR